MHDSIPPAPSIAEPTPAAPPLPTVLDPLDRALFVEADARARLAAIALRDAQQAFTAATERANAMSARITAKYGIWPSDTINPDTGVITRAPAK